MDEYTDNRYTASASRFFLFSLLIFNTNDRLYGFIFNLISHLYKSSSVQNHVLNVMSIIIITFIIPFKINKIICTLYLVFRRANMRRIELLFLNFFNSLAYCKSLIFNFPLVLWERIWLLINGMLTTFNLIFTLSEK